MVPLWMWILLGAMGAALALEQLYVFQVRRESRKRDELFQIVTENAADMIALVDVKGHRLYNSPAYKRILGYSPEELSETSAFEQIHPDDRFRVLEAAREAKATGVGRKLEYRIRHKDGTWRVLESVAGTIRDGNGDVSKLVIVNRDVTERKRAEERAEHNSFHDLLTGLPNRQLFLDRLQHAVSRAQRDETRRFAVLFIDLDGFKSYNHTMGQGAGDQILVEMGRRLGACLREPDTLARPQEEAGRNALLSRMGGDEFTVLLEVVSDPSDAMRVAQRLLSGVTALFLVEGREVRTSASIGIALSGAAPERAEDLLQDAESAMRRAKALGGNRCEVFDEASHTQAVTRLKLESELREAHAGRQFRLLYQPIVQLEASEIMGFEALLRWQHPVQGLISPLKFLAAAEDAGLLISAGQWAIQEACRQLKAWELQFPAATTAGISVNVSARQLADDRFMQGVERTLWETGVAPQRLQLEVTEAAVAANPKVSESVIPQLKQLRVGVVLDDFGTSPCSLLALQQVPTDTLKIDRSLVSAMMADRGACETIELIILLAHKLKRKIIAEGIESARQRERLRELGCDYGQGHSISEPIDAKAAGEWLARQNPRPQANGARAR